MHPRLQNGLSIGTFTHKGSSEKHYFVENRHENQFEISYHKGLFQIIFYQQKFRKSVLCAGAPGYACTALFAINLISTVFIGLLMVCDMLFVCYNIFT